MAGIVSKNLYELLGNDADQDPDREPEPPTKAIDKPTARKGKRDAAGEAPSANSRGGGARTDEAPAREKAARDRPNNRGNDGDIREERHPDRAPRGDSRDSRGRGRGARGGRGGGRGGGSRDDRHSKSGIHDNEKQAAHGWGGQTGNDEWADEKAGEAIAKDEENTGFDTGFSPTVNDEGGFVPDTTGAGKAEEETKVEEVEEVEDKSKSYGEYLAEMAAKKLQLGGVLASRKPNEGSDKKFPEGKAIERADEESYMAGTGGKAGRSREKKTKEKVQLNDEERYKAIDMGGRGGGRGGRGRGRGEGGGFRGDRGDRGDRGGRGRGGGFRGDRGGDFGGRGRGSRGPRGSPSVNVDDQSAFPSLGS